MTDSARTTTRKEEIVLRAMELFRNKGVRGVSMADIAAAVGMLKGSLYAHFGSKEDIVMDVLDATNALFDETVFSLAYDEHLSVRVRMQKMNKGLLEYFQDKKVCLVTLISLEGEADEFPGAPEKMHLFFRRWRDSLTHLLESEYSKDEAERLALLSVGRVEGAAVIHHVCKTDETLQYELDAILALLKQ